MNNNTFDTSIPTLTEVISNMPEPSPKTISVNPIFPAVMAMQEPAASTELPATPSLSNDEWDMLERNISERVLRQVLSRIDFVLEHRVRDSLADALQLAVEGVSIEIKRGLHQTLEDVISRAVSQEITKLQSTNK
jgi:hypothetical protein